MEVVLLENINEDSKTTEKNIVMTTKSTITMPVITPDHQGINHD